MKMRAPLPPPRPSATRQYLRRIAAALRLLGVSDGDRRVGLHLCEPYDPHRRAVVMIHGLGGNAIAWAHLTQAIERSQDLHARFQVWHLVYNSNAPMLVVRRRAQGYLDEAWCRLDPEGHAASRSGMVLIGHSLGGVVARMLCVDSGDTLWTAAFTVPHQAVLDDALAAQVAEVFRFQPYPGIGRAIFLAAPHKGSPNADQWLGRLLRTLMGGRTAEIQQLRNLVREHPDMVRDELRETYQRARVNSVSTLQVSQPVRRAGEALLPDGRRFPTTPLPAQFRASTRRRWRGAAEQRAPSGRGIDTGRASRSRPPREGRGGGRDPANPPRGSRRPRACCLNPPYWPLHFHVVTNKDANQSG